MVIGHLGLAYAVRSRWPRAELLALLVASALPDLVDFALPQGDQCRTSCALFSHAVPAVFLLAAVAATFAWAIWHRSATSLWTGCLVLVHVVADLVTGDKPYWPGGPSLGLALYTQHSLDFVMESAMFFAGWMLLRRRSDAPRWAVGFTALGLALALQLAFNVWHWRGAR